jgi:hypothetical protein
VVSAAAALSQGVQINLVAGTYSEAVVPNYWENRLGKRAAPIIVRAADGPGTARLPTVNVFGWRHLYFEGIDVSAGGVDARSVATHRCSSGPESPAVSQP